MLRIFVSAIIVATGITAVNAFMPVESAPLTRQDTDGDGSEG